MPATSTKPDAAAWNGSGLDAAPPARALAVMHLADVSGPSRSLEDELRWLAEGGELEVLVPGEGRLRSELAPFARVRALRYAALTVPSGPREWAAAPRRLAREVRGFRAAIRAAAPEVVILASALLPTALLAARLEGVPTVLYAGEILDKPRVPSRIRALAGAAVLGFAARTATAVIACSERVARQYRIRGAARTTTIHPPIGERYANGDGARFRRDHEIPGDAPLIVAVGAITHGRGQDVAIRALARIRAAYPDVRLAIVGDPHPRVADREYARELRRLAQDVVPGAVTFTGFEERVEDAYAAADVVVNPTRYEAFGRVAFEAMVAGRPVVSTCAGAVPDLLRDRSDALLVAPDDPAPLAEAAVQLLDDRELATRLAETGSARARAELAPERSLALFRSTVHGSLPR